ncbi:MAG: YceI family protein [Crocinitomicaceae bacterium]|nr:YceI family protein [Crocinitomicaceae bacterium]
METKWTVDNMHSEIGFKVKHMMITNVSGNFSDFSADATTQGDDFSTAQFNFSAAINSINTGVADRDAHLKADDFFNAEVYPSMTFKSSEVVKKTDDEFKLIGDLTIRDTTKKVELDVDFGGIVVDPYGQTKAGLTISGKIKRSEFGLKWSAVTEAGSIVLSDDIRLNSEIQFIKQ